MSRTRQPFRSRQEVERYFSGKTIQCLLCGERFCRLSFHLSAKHKVTTDEYKSRFGLPWTRGLTSAASRANSGWSEKRKRNARRLARRTQFYRFAHPAPRRAVAPFLITEAKQHLCSNALGFGRTFETRAHALFRRGLSDAQIARVLGVHRMTVNRRTKCWRKSKRKS